MSDYRMIPGLTQVNEVEKVCKEFWLRVALISSFLPDFTCVQILNSTPSTKSVDSPLTKAFYFSHKIRPTSNRMCGWSEGDLYKVVFNEAIEIDYCYFCC
ncbi:hypothetical protein Bca4012_065381 [Brassica carinata]